MRQKTIFVLLLAVILLIGYYSVDIAELLSDTSDSEQTQIARDVGASGAIYISSGKDISFDPMSILEHPDKYGDTSDELDSQYYDALVLCEKMLLQMSRYSEETEFDEPNAGSIYRDLKISGNGYAYLDRCEYSNIRGETRCLDCIISLDDYRVVYIRFYSPDEKVPESADITSALNEFRHYSDELYSSQADLPGVLEKIYSSYWSFRGEIGYESISNNEYLDTEFAIAFDIVSEAVDIDSPLLSFWLDTMSVSLVEFYNGDILSVLGTSYVIRKLASDYAVTSPSYSLYNGSIYQSVYLGGYQLVTIYNIEGGYVEGFYLEPEPNDASEIISSFDEADE